MHLSHFNRLQTQREPSVSLLYSKTQESQYQCTLTCVAHAQLNKNSIVAT